MLKGILLGNKAAKLIECTEISKYAISRMKVAGRKNDTDERFFFFREKRKIYSSKCKVIVYW